MVERLGSASGRATRPTRIASSSSHSIVTRHWHQACGNVNVRQRESDLVLEGRSRVRGASGSGGAAVAGWAAPPEGKTCRPRTVGTVSDGDEPRRNVRHIRLARAMAGEPFGRERLDVQMRRYSTFSGPTWRMHGW
jgi:hypothetical protein